jgi:hypothetical protein
MRIEGFRFGTIRVDGKDYGSDVVLLPPDVKENWWRNEGHRLFTADLAEVLAYRPVILVVGKGSSGHMCVPEETVKDMESAGIQVEVLTTDRACERFNELMKKGERVAAALHLTC